MTLHWFDIEEDEAKGRLSLENQLNHKPINEYNWNDYFISVNKLKNKMKKFSIDVQASGNLEMEKVRKYLRKNGYSVRKRKDVLNHINQDYLSNNHEHLKDRVENNDFSYYNGWLEDKEELLTLPQDWDKLIAYAPPKKTRQVISIYGEVYDSEDIDGETFGKAFNEWLHDMGWNFIGEHKEDNKKVG